MFWSRLEKGGGVLGGRPLWSYLFNLLSLERCKLVYLIYYLDKLFMTKIYNLLSGLRFPALVHSDCYTCFSSMTCNGRHTF